MESSLRKEVTEQWDERGTPPVIGKNEKVSSKTLRNLNLIRLSIGKRI